MPFIKFIFFLRVEIYHLSVRPSDPLFSSVGLLIHMPVPDLELLCFCVWWASTPPYLLSVFLAGLAHSSLPYERVSAVVFFFMVSAHSLLASLLPSAQVSLAPASWFVYRSSLLLRCDSRRASLLAFWDLLPHEEVYLSILPAGLQGGGPLKEPPGHTVPFS